MAHPRLLAPWTTSETPEQRPAIYHCVSRIVGRQYLLGTQEKEQFVKFMRLYEQVCGLRILSYCIMSNHFHILLEVPPRQDNTITNETLLERIALTNSPQTTATLREQIETLANSPTPEAAETLQALRQQHTKRMWDMGLYIKTLKQRFTSYYNKKHNRRGTLWESRYKSTLVQDGEASRTIAAYIDLNPVRAGITKDPANYRWTTYATALAGDQLSRNAIARLHHLLDTNQKEHQNNTADGWQPGQNQQKLTHHRWGKQAARYRLSLYEDALIPEKSETKTNQLATPHKNKKGITQPQLDKETKRKGHLPLATLARIKTRHYTAGALIGTKEWVAKTTTALKNLPNPIIPKTRKSPPAKLPKTNLHTLRNLKT